MYRHSGSGGGISEFLEMHLMWLFWFLWFGGGCAVLGAIAEISYSDTRWERAGTLALVGGAMLAIGWIWHKTVDPLGYRTPSKSREPPP